MPDGPILTVRMTGGTDFAVGDKVAVEIDPQQTYIYRATGTRSV